MKRILILNNYSVKRVAKEINDGLKPGHHLYGILELEKEGFELLVIDPEQNFFWDKLGNLIDRLPFGKIGNLYQQIRAFKRRREYDIIYAPCRGVTEFLGILSYLGIFNKKIIAISHHPILVGRLSFIRKYGYKLILNGHYKWGALSSKVADEINTIANKNIATCFHWGPEIKYYTDVANKIVSPLPTKTVDLISVGRTGRDYQTIIDAFNDTTITVEIYCEKQVAQQLTNNHTPNIKITHLNEHESLKYPELIALYLKAKIMVIPLFKNNSLAGLTSLMDAIALGMPVIMTKNDYLEIDIEKEEMGYWIKAGDSNQLRKIAVDMLTNRNLERFSANSKRLAENNFNTTIYYKELLDTFKNL
jgi:glycosyltransferase involved in cell wall biosynthesis